MYVKSVTRPAPRRSVFYLFLFIFSTMKNYCSNSARSLYLDSRGNRTEVQQRLEALVRRMKMVANGQQKLLPQRDAVPLFTRASRRLRDAKLAEVMGRHGKFQIASFAPDYDSADSLPIVQNILPRMGGGFESIPIGIRGAAKENTALVLPEESPVEFDRLGRIRKADDSRLCGADLFHYVACHVRQDLAVTLFKGNALRYMVDISACEKTPKDAQGRNTFVGRDLHDIHVGAPNFGPVLRELFPLLIQLFREDMLDVLTVDLNGQKLYKHDEAGEVRRFERDRFIPLKRPDESFMGVLGAADVFFQRAGEKSPYEGGDFVPGIELQSDVSTKAGKMTEMLKINKMPYTEMLRLNAVPHGERIQLLRRLLSDRERYFDEVVAEATRVNRLAFGEKLKLYGISYISDECVNDCTYCGHRASLGQVRSSLTPEQMEKDFSAVMRYRPEEFCILAGEHPNLVEQCCQALRVISDVNEKFESPLECLTLNIAPQSVADFEKIVGAADPAFRLQYRIFQETYDPALYAMHHASGPKSRFDFRLTAQERALQAGFSDVGIGALMGLNTAGHDSEIVSLLQHADRIKQLFGRYPKSLSIPRHQRVEGSAFSTPNPVDDRSYMYYHALLRIFLPETELIITSRETPELIQALEPLVNVRDLAPRPGVGGNVHPGVHFQNELGDCRSAEEILEDLKRRGKR